jgi:hypothetical protein
MYLPARAGAPAKDAAMITTTNYSTPCALHFNFAPPARTDFTPEAQRRKTKGAK